MVSIAAFEVMQEAKKIPAAQAAGKVGWWRKF